LQEDPQGLAHPHLIGVRWEGGFLDEVKIRLNESLNVLIGGRGSGKSTVIESIRYALEIPPLAAVSQATHDSMIRDVLGSGAKVTLEVEVRTPSPTIFTIERLVGSKPVVRGSAGALLQSAPADVLRGTEVYGQRELAELARNRQQLTALLAQYLPDSNELGHSVSTHARSLERSRLRILALQQDLEGLDARLARMPIVKQRLTRFDEAGVGEKLQEQDRAQQEEQLLSLALSSVQAIPQVLENSPWARTTWSMR
jgi:DNA repair exonuclease SbcCD ATPase subunit